jgi:hypothetical protein
MFLRCSVYQAPKQWKKWLFQAELWYNTTYHSSLKCSAFKALYGYDPDLLAIPSPPYSANVDVQEWSKEREVYNGILTTNVLAAQNKFKIQADKHRTDKEFQMGEQVLLKSQP